MEAYLFAVQDAFVSDPTAILKPGQVVTVRVVSYEDKNSRLSLTMRSTTDSGTATGPSGLERDATRAKQEARRGKNATAGVNLDFHLHQQSSVVLL